MPFGDRLQEGELPGQGCGLCVRLGIPCDSPPVDVELGEDENKGLKISVAGL